MSTRYHGEQMSRDVAKAILFLLRFGSKQISELIKDLRKEGIKVTPDQARRTARYLKRNEYITGNAYKGYGLTKSGLKRLAELELSEIKVPNSWDGKWRIILFDIPEEKRSHRNQVRRLIKELSCIQLQKSVWVHPFPCFEQFRNIRDTAELKGEIILIETDIVEGVFNLVKIFKKLYPKTDFDINTN